jgi:hypothetical protein
MKTRADPALLQAVVQAAARLLEADPEISNPRMLQRLAALLGPIVTQEIPVTRMERLVREPALRLLRDGAVNGDRPGPFTTNGAGVGSRPAQEGHGPSSDQGSERHRRAEAKELQSVDQALLEAFSLGATAESIREMVEAFRKLDRVRGRVRSSLNGER